MHKALPQENCSAPYMPKIFEATGESQDASLLHVPLNFAEVYYTVCASFDGVDVEDLSLRVKLLSADVFVEVTKKLDALETELEKTEKLEPATLAMAIKLLQALVPMWDTVIGADLVHPGRRAHVEAVAPTAPRSVEARP